MPPDRCCQDAKTMATCCPSPKLCPFARLFRTRRSLWLENVVLRKKSVRRQFGPQVLARSRVARVGPLMASWRPHENSRFSVPLRLRPVRASPRCSFFSDSGRRSTAALKAENIFLRKQLALYLERQKKPRRASNATRLSLVLTSRLFAWRDALVIVKPETFLGWHRRGFRLLWRWKSRPRGRPRLPENIQELIVRMARGNLTWGEERIAAELLLKLGIRVSPRTVRRYMPLDEGPQKRMPSQSWMTFVLSKKILPHTQATMKTGDLALARPP
jgi:hypothetical protein